MALTNATTLADYGAGIGTQGATLKVDATNKRVGVGTDSPAGPEGSLQVGLGITMEGDTGRATFVGIITASSFSGDGSGLTGVANTENVIGTAITMTSGNITNLTGAAATFTGPISVGNTISLGDHDRLRFGAGNDLQIYHDGDDSLIEEVGTGRLNIRTNGDSIKLQNTSGGQEAMGVFNSNGSVELYYNGTKTFETGPAGTITVGVGTFDGLSLGDSEIAKFGDGDDLQIHHTAGNSFIQDKGAGILAVTSNGAGIRFMNDAQSEFLAKFEVDGAVELYHDNSKKFETIGAGVTITGDLNVSGDARIVGVLTVGSSSLVLDGDQGTINGVVHPTSGALSNRNLIINGAMQVAQRGTTITGIGVDDYTCCDRFKHFAAVSGQAGRLTATQETITDLAGFHKALKLQVTTTETPGSTESYGLNTRLEHQDTKGLNIGSSSSIPLTLSFYAKAPTGNGVFCAGICIPGGGSYIEEVTVGTSWSRHEINIPATTNSAHATSQTNDNHSGMEVQITLMAGSSVDGHAGNTWETGTNNRATSNQSNFFSSTSNNLWITGVQLERGEKATPFEHRTFADELDRCYRYYQSSFGLGNVPGTSTDLTDSIITTSWTDGNAPFPQFARPMRTAPSVTLRGRGETTTGQVENGSVDRSASAQQINEKHVGYLAVSSGTGGQFNAFSYVLECDM